MKKYIEVPIDAVFAAIGVNCVINYFRFGTPLIPMGEVIIIVVAVITYFSVKKVTDHFWGDNS